MAVRKLPLLHLKGQGLVAPEDDRSIELAVYDVLLPCRMFQIDHKVAVLGRTSLTTEFLLRLVKAVPGISQEDAGAFFGFNLREASFVLAEAEAPGFVERRDGRLWLTVAGDALFRDGSAEPEIFAVEPRRKEVGFDLISLAPQHPRFLTEFELGLPELVILDEETAGSAAAKVPHAFKKFFSEIGDRRDRKGEKRELYSVDPAVSKNRFLSTVRTVLRAQASYPSSEESDLSLWRPDHEQADRPEIVSAIASFVDGLKQSRSDADAEAYGTLLDLAPDFLKDFARRDGLSVERYYRDAITRTGDVRADRKTAPILGSLLLADNLKRFVDVLDYGSRTRPGPPRFLLWLAPVVPWWGATTLLDDTLTGIRARWGGGQRADEPAETLQSICLTSPRPPRYVEKAFNLVCTSDIRRCPGPLEILLVPHVGVAVLVHAPIGEPRGYPVPLGFVSFDETVLRRTHEYLLERIDAHLADESLYRRVASALSGQEP
jgi:hypothetical protein